MVRNSLHIKDNIAKLPMFTRPPYGITDNDGTYTAVRAGRCVREPLDGGKNKTLILVYTASCTYSYVRYNKLSPCNPRCWAPTYLDTKWYLCLPRRPCNPHKLNVSNIQHNNINNRPHQVRFSPTNAAMALFNTAGSATAHSLCVLIETCIQF